MPIVLYGASLLRALAENKGIVLVVEKEKVSF